MALATPAPFGFEKAWIARSLRLLAEQPDLLERRRVPEAVTELGIGNRKVLALRFWLRTMGLADINPSPPRLTVLGQVVRAYDPELDEPGTWQMLHWRLARVPDGASAYWHFVHALEPREVDQAMLRDVLARAFPDAAPRTVRDAAFVTFATVRDTPLSGSSGLYERANERLIRCRLTSDSIASGVLSHALLDWFAWNQRTTANLAELVERGGPGRAFGLSLPLMESALLGIQDRYGKRVVWLSRTAGLHSVGAASDVPPTSLVEAHYLEQLEGLDPIAALTRSRERGISSAESEDA